MSGAKRKCNILYRLRFNYRQAEDQKGQHTQILVGDPPKGQSRC